MQKQILFFRQEEARPDLPALSDSGGYEQIPVERVRETYLSAGTG